jgi:hypothetical protein
MKVVNLPSLGLGADTPVTPTLLNNFGTYYFLNEMVSNLSQRADGVLLDLWIKTKMPKLK